MINKKFIAGCLGQSQLGQGRNFNLCGKPVKGGENQAQWGKDV